jgi:hypothetical protein
MNEDINNIISWAHDRNLINGSTVKDQFVKLTEELGELAAGIARGNNEQIEDSIGDMVVVLTILSEIHGNKFNKNDLPYIEEYTYGAYQTIKDRKGKMVNGVFVKEE